ncbi:hypothetical protein FSP39_002053 [Pinctada imbricata]|uniref:Tight junction-associated protein 1 n=1 Tax=Pinctada imbricata TaxID=66713 RepID=A0AA88Y9Z1_PINIB|nr:hypothetical protein FSP39_002053 [Pinctada imbricata]
MTAQNFFLCRLRRIATLRDHFVRLSVCLSITLWVSQPITFDCLDLHQQIVELESQLRKSNNHISKINHELLDCKQTTDYEVMKYRDEINKLRERYDRLLESHKRLQKVNHELEDKLLKVVNGFEAEKIKLQRENASMMSKLVDAKVAVCELEEENEKFRNDCNIAVQMLQCKPSEFVSHKLHSLPVDLQERVKAQMSRQQIINCEESQAAEPKIVRVPMATFPPTAMVYTLNNSHGDNLRVKNGKEPDDNVPMDIITKVLTQPESKRRRHRTYICLNCKRDVSTHDKDVQVSLGRDATGNSESLAGLKVHQSSNRLRSYSSDMDN